MKVVLKPIFDILTGDVAICNNVIYNYLILVIVGEIAYRFSYSIVGYAYDNRIIRKKESGSVLHWAIRCVIYVIIAYFLCALIWVYNFVLIIPHWIWWFLVLSIIGTMIFVIVFKHIKNQKNK